MSYQPDDDRPYDPHPIDLQPLNEQPLEAPQLQAAPPPIEPVAAPSGEADPASQIQYATDPFVAPLPRRCLGLSRIMSHALMLRHGVTRHSMARRFTARRMRNHRAPRNRAPNRLRPGADWA